MPELEIPEIRDIAAPVQVDASWPLAVWLIIGFFALALAAILILLITRKNTPAALPPDYNGRQSALTKLHSLKENYLKIAAPEFALGASHGMREYLTSFYGPTTPFETGKEFLERQDDRHLMSEEKYVLVRNLFQRAEDMKYAPAPGADSHRLDLVQDIIDFVRDDTPGLQLTPAPPSKKPETDADSTPA